MQIVNANTLKSKVALQSYKYTKINLADNNIILSVCMSATKCSCKLRERIRARYNCKHSYIIDAGIQYQI